MVIVWLDGDAEEGGDGALSVLCRCRAMGLCPTAPTGARLRCAGLEPVVDVGEFTLFVEWWVLHE